MTLDPPRRDVGIAVFDTAVGSCGIAWGEAGIVGVQLPEGDARRTLRRLARRFPGAVERFVSPEVRDAIDRIIDLLNGGSDDLAQVTLDMHGVPEFNQQVYALARAITPGETSTYGELAARLGDPTVARAVGQALGQNPFPSVVPCHRVLATGGRMGGFSAPGGVDTKRKLLVIEGAAAVAQLPLFDAPADND